MQFFRWDAQLALRIADLDPAAWAAIIEQRERLFAAGAHLLHLRAPWKVAEVAAMGRALAHIGRVFGNGGEHLVRGVRLVRLRQVRFPLVYAGRPCPAFEAFGRVWLGDAAFRSPLSAEHSVVHELGHYVQESLHLLGQFKQARSDVYPCPYARTSAVEDFASSFEIFVYERIGEPVVENGVTLTVDDSRAAFFSQLVR